MKRMIAIALALILALSLAACANETDPESSSQPPVSEPSAEGSADTSEQNAAGQESDGQTAGETKTLIAYFTRARNIDLSGDVDAISSVSINLVDGEYVGNTELLARWIQEEMGGDLFQIQTENLYPADYDENLDYAERENSENARPALAAHVENMADYDTIFLGFSNWWYDMPMAVYSFLEEYDLAGKTIVPFCTSGGSRFSDALNTIRDMEPGAELLDGLAVSAGQAIDAQDSVLDWLADLGFTR